MLIGIASRVLGVFREVLLAQFFGVGALLDAVYLGLAIPMTLTLGIGGGLSTAVVPIAVRLGKGRFAGLLWLGTRRLVALLAPMALVLAATSPIWTSWLAIGSAAPPRNIVLTAAALGCVAIVGSAIAGLYRGLANARGRHVSGSLNHLTYNVIVCGTILLTWRTMGPLSLLLGTVLAEWSQVVVLWPAVAPLIRRVRPVEREEDWLSIRAIFWPMALIGVAQSLNVSIDRAFGTLLETGAIAALAYGERLVNLPVSLLGAALAVPLFTRLSAYRARNDMAAFDRALQLGLRLFLFAGAPMGIVLAGAGQPLIGLLLERGKFDATAVVYTSQVMLGYAPGVPFQAMVSLLIGAGLGMGRHWAVMWVMAVSCGLNALLNWVLVGPLGLMGIALSTSIVSLARVVLLLWAIRPGLLGSAGLWRAAWSSLLFAAMIAAGLWIVQISTGLLTATGTAARVAGVLAAAMVLSAAVALAWKPMLRREWATLTRLRGHAARDAESPRRGGSA